jgi:hypothetical protein
MPHSFELELPPNASHPEGQNTIQSNGVIVVIGANGTGKTRLGSWIEFRPANVEHCHRVAAQKSLTFPSRVSPIDVVKAQAGLLFGHEDAPPQNFGVYKTGHRWAGKPDTILLDDFQRLVVYLFSEETQSNAEYKRKQKGSVARIEPPVSRLDRLKLIWERTLPQRELIIGGAKVETRTKAGGGATYRAEEMSDGERVIFYLIGQVLSAPTDGIIIVDEPELHLHRSVQAKLWDELEAERADCLFVYLTHDLDFAASRINSTKIWLKEFDGTTWLWDVLPPVADAIPEDLFLEIVGSRKPILFIEGERASLDYFTFTHLYPGWTVTPLGGCGRVLNATQTFESLKKLHGLTCRGIIDRDARSKEEIDYLKGKQVAVLQFAEVENLYLLEEVLRIAAKELFIAEIEETIAKAKDIVVSDLAKDRELVVSRIVARTIEQRLVTFDSKALGADKLADNLKTLLASIDVAALYGQVGASVDAAINARDYNEALRLYANKGLGVRIGALFGQKDFPDYLRRLLASPSGKEVLEMMRKYAPEF